MFDTFSYLDKRLKRRAFGILDQMSTSKTAILNRFSSTRSNYVGNCGFFNNKSVGLPPLCDLLTSPVRKLVKGKHVLNIQDTSVLNFMHHGGRLSIQDEHLGLVGIDRSAGFFLHPSLVVGATQGEILGLSDIQIWNRSFSKFDKKSRDYQSLPLEEKESHRWLTGSNSSKEVLKQASRVTIIADRESDIYENLLYMPDSKTDIILRAGQNRCLHENDDKLYESP